MHVKAVLVAAEDSIPAFGNATAALRGWLRQRGVPAADIRRVGGRGVAGTPASLDTILGAVAALGAGPGDSCLVYITGHGLPEDGVWVPYSQDTLVPNELDQALVKGCHLQPTVVVVSACYSGVYLDGRLPRGNRVVITAARRDRTSFGCGVRDRFTYFDGCLLHALGDPAVANWEAALASARRCVGEQEAAENVLPSEPQLSVGRAVRGMQLPGAPPPS